jgi:F0F1-type ATP synthase membrane subunit c/vacuolar-type H+-ATPase subunit K
MSNDSPAHDPGWAPALRRPGSIVRAFASVARARLPRADGEPIVLGLRAAFVASALTIAALVGALGFFFPLIDLTTRVELSARIVLYLGAVVLAGAVWARGREIDCAPEPELAEDYARGFFIGAATAETAALLGVVATFIAGEWWPALIGGALYAGGIVLVAPTHRDITRRDQRLHDTGCSRSLATALYETGP